MHMTLSTHCATSLYTHHGWWCKNKTRVFNWFNTEWKLVSKFTSLAAMPKNIVMCTFTHWSVVQPFSVSVKWIDKTIASIISMAMAKHPQFSVTNRCDLCQLGSNSRIRLAVLWFYRYPSALWSFSKSTTISCTIAIEFLISHAILVKITIFGNLYYYSYTELQCHNIVTMSSSVVAPIYGIPLQTERLRSTVVSRKYAPLPRA